MDSKEIAKEIAEGKAILGIEAGSTRIKALLINSKSEPVAQGAYDWENSLVDGVWTYSLDLIRQGFKSAYSSMKKDVLDKYGVKLTHLKAMGVSAMMHGYLAFDKDNNLLVPFRTWRNTITKEASEALSALFNYPVPERWSVAHLYQAILKGEEHVDKVAFITTLAGYVHWQLTGEKVLGIGDASGMFPIDTTAKNYDTGMLAKFDKLVADKHYPWQLKDILPRSLLAGEKAGTLTESGARLLDSEGDLCAGVPLCPPEGDAGTGMAATNSVAPRTGNVSAGTSVFAMVVLEKPLKAAYSGKIDLVTTPDGYLTAMAHANNCTGEYDKWIKLMGEAAAALGAKYTKGQLYDTLLDLAMKGDDDCGGLIPFNYISGESITDMPSGRPLFVRAQNAAFTLPNFMRAELFSALATLRAGMDILFEKEGVKLDTLVCQGGFFKAQAGLMAMSAAMHTPVSALATAGEGGPWGMALLAAYMAAVTGGDNAPLGKWLADNVFADAKSTSYMAEKRDIDGFNAFFARYVKALPVERAAMENVE